MGQARGLPRRSRIEERYQLWLHGAGSRTVEEAEEGVEGETSGGKFPVGYLLYGIGVVFVGGEGDEPAEGVGVGGVAVAAEEGGGGVPAEDRAEGLELESAGVDGGFL